MGFANACANRSFLQRSYPTMKKHNPHTPILIREASGIEPTLYARYSASPSLPRVFAPHVRRKVGCFS